MALEMTGPTEGKCTVYSISKVVSVTSMVLVILEKERTDSKSPVVPATLAVSEISKKERPGLCNFSGGTGNISTFQHHDNYDRQLGAKKGPFALPVSGGGEVLISCFLPSF